MCCVPFLAIALALFAHAFATGAPDLLRQGA
jgi:hypothetical protein